MKTILIVLTALAVPILSATAAAADFKVDSTFNPALPAGARVHDIVVLPDEKIVAVGQACPVSDSECDPFVRRLNTDGSIDPGFNAPLNPAGGTRSGVHGIVRLANGQFLIRGHFRIGTALTNYARLNADGSVDSSMPPSFVNDSFGFREIKPLSDGKFLVCSERTINGELFKTAHRLNSDGTPDPTFRVTFTDAFCRDLEVLPDGKILIALGVFPFQDDVHPLRRLNTDGSLDASFVAAVEIGSIVDELQLRPDGKMLFAWQSDSGSTTSIRRLHADGALDLDNTLCGDDTFTVMPDESLYAMGCKRWSGTFGKQLGIAKVNPDGTVDPTVDNLFYNEVSGWLGFKYVDAGSNRLYVKGPFTGIKDNPPARWLARLVPNTTPLKARFDFDNDGRSDLVVYRPSEGIWYLNQSSAGFSYKYWGLANDVPAAAHFDNDGKTDIAVFRNGEWHAWSESVGYRPINVGGPGDKAMSGNFEDRGNDFEDHAARGIRNGVPTWFIREGWTTINQIYTAHPYTLQGELASDKPVVGDFNGDSRDEIGYFRDGYWYTRDYNAMQGPATMQWGLAGDIPVPGDYDGDRQTDYAIFRPSTGAWWINRSTDGVVAISFGLNGDIPVPADYDGDGKVDIAIYRNGQWWQLRSGDGTVRVENWGIAGDIPIPAQSQF